MLFVNNETCRRRFDGGSLSVAAPVRALACSVAAILVALGVSSPARAATGHQFLSSISEAPSGRAIGEPTAVAVQRSTGRVFVADPQRGVVDVFNAAGAFETQFGEGLDAGGLAVDEETGEIYVAEPSGDAILVFKPDNEGGYTELSTWTGANTPTGEFGEVTGAAIDNSKSASDLHAGDVYVVDGSNDAVYTFKPNSTGPEEAKEGTFVESLAGGKLEEPNGAAVDSATGQVYVADSTLGAIDVYSSAGSFEAKLNGTGSPTGTFEGPEEEEGNVAGLAIDEASGDIYVAEAQRGVLSQFNGEGKWIGWVTTTPSGALGEPRGVAIAPSGDVYLSDARAHLIDVFGPGVIVPDTETTPAKVSKASATLNGIVNGDGTAARYRFQWGTTRALGAETQTQSAGTAEQKVFAELSGLTANSTYYFRLVSENENGTNYGAIREFTTRPAVEGLATGPVANLTPTSATLTGSLDPKGIDTHYYFEWGKTSAYGNRSPEPPADAGEGKAAVTAQTNLSALAPNTTYHYRLIGEDSFGSSEGEDARFTTPGPPRIKGEPATVEGHEAATLHARIDPDQRETEYRFEYGETSAYGHEVPLGGAKIPAGEVAVAESAALTGLKIGTTYHYRVVAVNAAGTTSGRDQTFTTLPAAPTEALFATDVSASEATLQAQINPLGHDTTYYFQYGPESCALAPAACTSVPSPPVDIGAGETGVAESVRLTGLQASTTYHYRVVAKNVLGTADSQEKTFTTQEGEAPFALADNRAWELVSPPDKHGAPIEALTREGGIVLAAEVGDSLTYVANGAVSGESEEPHGNRSPEMQQILATRGPEKWSSEDIATPQSRAQGVSPGSAPEYQFFTPDLSLALVEPWGTTPLAEPPLGPGATQKTMYIRDNQAGTYLPLVTEANVPPGTQFGLKLEFMGATPDLSHVVLHSTVALTQAPSGPGLYEWAGGKLQFLSLLPDEKTAAPAAELGFHHIAARAISNDGSRVIWTSMINGPGHLYMTDSVTHQTVQLDAAQGRPEPEEGSAQFQTASANGSTVFFTDKQQLTADSTAKTSFPEKADLYACEMKEEAGKLSCRLKDLTVDSFEGESAGVQGFLFGASEDGSSVYLVAQGVLAENENGNGEMAESGRDNLYTLKRSGGEWTTSFVAMLSSEDGPEWEGNKLANTAFLTARVSPNGRYLAFMSNASLTGYDNRDAASGKRDEEVYLYDSEAASEAARLTCVSCNPSGARPHGVFDTVEAGEGLGLVVDRRKVWAEAGHEHWLAGNIPGWTAQSLADALFQSRYLSDEGRLFFNSADALVAQVADRTRQEEVAGKKISVGVENVYEYEPAGVGSCQSQSGGCVALMSSGSSDRESAFLEATPSGDDLFFLTAAQLVAQDGDSAFDIYDARVCTEASPCLTPIASASRGCDTATACRASEPGQEAQLTPTGSAVTSGQSNIGPSQGSGKPPTRPKPLTRAQKLAKAMKACKKIKSRKKRAACDARAARMYGKKTSAKKTSAKKTSARARQGAR